MSQEASKIFYEFPKDESDKVRIIVREYRGKKYFDVRVWYLPEGKNEAFPTRKGLCLSMEYLQQVRAGLDQLAHVIIQNGPAGVSGEVPSSGQRVHSALKAEIIV